MSQMTIPARPEAGAMARRAVLRWLGEHPRLDDALLALTELVNNAVVHGGLGPGEDLTISFEPERGGIRLTVRHIGAPFEVADVPASVESATSRGLAIVGQIADRWGVDSNGEVVSAWFELNPRSAQVDSGTG